MSIFEPIMVENSVSNSTVSMFTYIYKPPITSEGLNNNSNFIIKIILILRLHVILRLRLRLLPLLPLLLLLIIILITEALDKQLRIKISFNKIMEIEIFTLSQDIIPQQDYKTLWWQKAI